MKRLAAVVGGAVVVAAVAVLTVVFRGKQLEEAFEFLDDDLSD